MSSAGAGAQCACDGAAERVRKTEARDQDVRIPGTSVAGVGMRKGMEVIGAGAEGEGIEEGEAVESEVGREGASGMPCGIALRGEADEASSAGWR